MGFKITIKDDKWYSENFKNIIRSNKEYLSYHSGIASINELAIIETNRYDFYKVCYRLGVPHHLLWATAYINDIADPFAKIEVENGYSIKTVPEDKISDMMLRANSKTL